MKKHTTLIALGILLSSHALPIMAKADTLLESSPTYTQIQENDEHGTVDHDFSPEADESDDAFIENSASDPEQDSLDISPPQSEQSIPKLHEFQASELSQVTEHIWQDSTGTSTVKMLLDEDGTLTVSGGQLVNPKPLINQFPADTVIKNIVFSDELIITGSATQLFSNLANTESIDFTHVNTSKVTDMSYMFSDTASLKSLDLSSFDTGNVTNMIYMFSGTYSLKSLNLSNFNTSRVTSMGSMFSSATSLASLDLSSFDTSNVTNMYWMFYNTQSLTTLNLSNFDTRKVVTMNAMFHNALSLTTLDISSFDTSNVNNMGSMFSGLNSLTSLDLSHFNTSNVINMNSMFSGASSLTSLDLSHFDTRNVTNMYSMFQNASALTSLNISNFDTSKIANMERMFNNTKSLTTLDLSSFDTSNVTNMSIMFHNTNSLTSLDLSNFDTSKVTTMTSMFHNSSSLTSLDISSFSTGSSTNMEKFLTGTYALNTLKLGTGFSFVDLKSGLPNITTTDVYTGFWEKLGDANHPSWTSNELMEKYNGSTDKGTYVWQKYNAKNVTVNYIDENSKEIESSETLTGKIGDEYKAISKTIQHYTLVGVRDNNETGLFTNEEQNVYYVYKQNEGANVTVRYVDEYDNEIESSEILTGKSGEKYEAHKKDIDHFTFKEVKDQNENGIFDDKEQTVTYIYTANAGADISVNYVDEDGETIEKAETLKGKFGDTYQAEQKTIKNYTFKEVKGNAEGTFTANAQDVTFIYSKDTNKVTTPTTDKGDSGSTANQVLGTNAVNQNANTNDLLPSTGDGLPLSITLIGSFFTAFAATIFALKRKKD